jgi:hypothetical protein
LTEKNLNEIYSAIFSCGDTSIFAKHLFAAMIRQHPNRMSSVCFIGPALNDTAEINFRDFLITLSSIMRGSIDDKIKWLFNFYDINRDGKITTDVGNHDFFFNNQKELLIDRYLILKEISSLIRCMYDLMGPNVNPPADEQTITNHIENVVQVSFGAVRF